MVIALKKTKKNYRQNTMKFTSSFRQRIFLYFSSIFTLFTIVILVYQYDREKRYRSEQLENTLDNLTVITRKFIDRNNLLARGTFHLIDSLTLILPHNNVRVSVFNHQGIVLYDSFVDDYSNMENHLARPEVQEALSHDRGSSIRKSATTKQKFYYYAKKYDHYFIRTAMVYDLEIARYLRAESSFFLFVLFLFCLSWILLFWITRKLGEFITRLKNFAIKADQNELVISEEGFTNDELGIIRNQIVGIYNKLNRTKSAMAKEKEKLFRHLQVLNEGIAFFGPSNEKLLSNSHFILYLGLISGKPFSPDEDVFQVAEFEPVLAFIEKSRKENTLSSLDDFPKFEYLLTKNEMYWKVQVILFGDNSFEVLLADVTKPEKRRLIKQQLTSNIAHELKTPLSSVKGYLETILNNQGLTGDKMLYFARKAYDQSNRLALLINDVSILNNIEDAGELFSFKEVNVGNIINEAVENLQSKLEQNQVQIETRVPENVLVIGNEALLFSIFQNLIENSIQHAGTGIRISITNYHHDENYYYFTYSDNGMGIPDEHLSRIFERFYRVDYGRARDTGGTGLGLAIVKNAIQLHKGEISVRNKLQGGVEFLFTLNKNCKL